MNAFSKLRQGERDAKLNNMNRLKIPYIALSNLPESTA